MKEINCIMQVTKRRIIFWYNCPSLWWAKGNMDWIDVTWEKYRWLVLVNALMNFRVP
jgi:hypothetical protein